MGNNRGSKSLKNLLYGTGAQILQSIFPFISRTVFIYTLGEAYLGVSGLFSSILAVLSLAELGIGNIVVYSLYKPLAEGNHDRVSAYIEFYKKIYRLIAGVVFGVGVLLIPFIPYLVKLPENMEHLYLYYILYVMNSAISYLYIYKSSVINADQKQYIVSIYTTVSTALMNIVQCVILLLFHNFILYLLIQLIFTFLLNFSLSRKADKLYSLKGPVQEYLTKEEKKEIFSNTRAMLSYKLGGTFLNSTDSMFISVLVNTIIVGLYTNYTILEGFLNKFINIVYDALYAGVGNLNVTESGKKQKDIFNVLTLVFTWIGTIGFAGYYLAANNVIRIWIGESYCIDNISVFALALRFYMPIILYPVWIYRNSTGLFQETKNILIYAGILNLILSYPLGKWFGLAGILFATSISRVLTSFWYEPVILYKKIFINSRVREYFINIIYSMIIVIFTITLNQFAEMFVRGGVLIHFLHESVLSVAVPSCAMLLRYRKTAELKYLINIIYTKRGR